MTNRYVGRRRVYEAHDAGLWPLKRPPRRGFTQEISSPPAQSLTQPLSIAGVKETSEMKEISSDLWKDILPGVQQIKYGPLEVTEMTYGYIIKAKYGKEGPRHWDPRRIKYVGRQLTTEGFAFYIDSNVFGKAIEIANKKKYRLLSTEGKDAEAAIDAETSVRQVVMHTLKHALLSRLPFIIGLEPSKVAGSYDFIEVKESTINEGARNVVYVYDSEEGGTGACETLFQDESSFLMWLDGARNTVKNCPSGSCRTGACRRCIFIETCGEVNYGLNRYLAAPVFFDDDLDWVYQDDW